MTPAAIPGAARPALRLRKHLRKWKIQGLQLARPAAPPLKNLASIPLFTAGLASMDFAAFHLAHGWGWLAVGVSLVVLEHAIADEQ